MILTVRVTSKGQVTIPKDVRDLLGICEGTRVTFTVEGDTVVIRKDADAPSRGRVLAQRMRGRGDIAMSTDEIMALTRPE